MLKRLLILMALVVPMGVLATLPASVVLPQAADGLHFQSVEGTIWSGRAKLAFPKQAPLPMRWEWSGGLIWSWAVESDEISVQGQWRLGQRDRLEHIEGTVDIEYLDIAQWLVVIWPVGQMEVNIDHLTWEANSFLHIHGELYWPQAKLRGLVNEDLGDITITMSPSEQQWDETDFVVRSSADGIVGISGGVSTNGDRYRASLVLKPRADRRELLRLLAPFGRQGDGGVRIERSGKLGVFDE